MATGLIVVLVTCSSKKEAEKISRMLLEKRLIACANIITGIESKFWWNGKIDKAKESLIILKTMKNKFDVVERQIRRVHSYEVPEIIALPVTAGSREYLKWVEAAAAGRYA